MMNRVLSFAGKARRRGLDYVGAVSAYQAHTLRYRVVAFSGQPGARVESHSPGTSVAPNPPFHFSTSDIPGIVGAIPESAKRTTILEAERCLGQKFSFRGLAEFHFPQDIEWDFVPDGNLSWSWDLNRHLFFLTLGAAYHYTQDAAYLEKLVALWDDWMRRNPVGKGLNWRSPFEVAARLRNWIWAYFLVAAAPGASSPFLGSAWNGLREHATFLSDHLEYHWPNNHLLLEALSLCEFAVVFRDFGGERYLPRASTIVAEQVERQVLADGVHGELCPMYHEIVASELNVFASLCRKLRFPLRTKVTERIAAMERFSSAMRRGDGSFPLLGDSSPADTCLRFGFAEPREHLAFWVRPDSGCLDMPLRKPLSLDIFAAAGYAILRGHESRAHLVFDFGPWSRCKTTNHGHSDALSFALHARGQAWIVDSGFFHPWSVGSIANLEWNRFFRSTAAHNTLLIDNREPFELSDHGDVRRQAATRLIGYRSDSQEVAVCGETQPCWSSGGTAHRREIALNQSGEVTVRDLVSLDPLPTTGNHRLQWYFHFGPDLAVQLSGKDTVVAQSGGGEMTCRVSCTGATPLLRLIRGQEFPRQGWVAQSTAVVVPAWVLAVELESSQSCEMTFDFRFAQVSANSLTQETCANRSA
jgi:uncharacterized heparinase superfamily protein